LAAELAGHAGPATVVLALPRGGVAVGFEIARAIAAPLDVWMVRKLGLPWHPELGVGAVSEGGYVHISRQILGHVGLSRRELAELTEAKCLEVEEGVRRFR